MTKKEFLIEALSIYDKDRTIGEILSSLQESNEEMILDGNKSIKVLIEDYAKTNEIPSHIKARVLNILNRTEIFTKQDFNLWVESEKLERYKDLGKISISYIYDIYNSINQVN